jgi:hypothetical protein
MSLHDVARHVLSKLCDEHHDGPAVVFSDSPTVERIPRRRHHARERERHRVSDMAREVIDHLRRGGDAATAHDLAVTAGLNDSIRVTRGYGELLEAIVDRFRAGDNAWADVSGAAEGVIAQHFWHDPTHPRVSDAYPFGGRS